MKKIVIVLSSLQGGGGAEHVALTLYQGFEAYPDVKYHIICLESVVVMT